MITLQLTREQVRELRRSLNNSAIKYLAKSYNTLEELKVLGRDGERDIPEMYMKLHDNCVDLIELLDKEMDRESQQDETTA